MAGKRSSLSEFASKKVEPPAPTSPATSAPVEKKADGRRGMTLRLSEEAWGQLKILAVEKRSTAHDLLIEGLNDLFRKNNKPPIA